MPHTIRIHNNSIQMTDLLKCLMPLEDYNRITPSRYMKEIGMTVEERLKFLNERSRTQKIGRQNKLWTIPDIVVFQNFETHVTYTTTILFMHQKQHPVRIKVLSDLNPCFRLKELPGTVYSKLAPGTPHKMILDFYSEEYTDYSSVLRFEAGEDTVDLPIVAFAPRAFITLPDEIELSKTVVNISSEKKVFMRNMGKTSVVFKLRAESPFGVCPRTGIIEPNEVLDVEISYKTFKVEKNVSNLIITFGGVNLYSTLKCESENCDVYLDKTVLHFEDTFLNLQRCIPLNLVNNSDHTMKYQWKQFKTKYDDIERCNQLREKLEEMKEYELLRNIQEENPNITDADLHKIFLERIYQDELREFDSTDQLLYHNTHFRFPEKSGLIGPRSVINIEVLFCPDEAEEYLSIAYLDVTGRETRQPLKLVGTGLGPEVILNFKILDVDDIYLCSKHQYEVVAKNEGNIPATLRYCYKDMDFGGTMSCKPNEVFINPKKCERMVLEFSSTVQGKFVEHLSFKIVESGEHVNCVFQGNVVCPLLSYNIAEIDFGVVAFGFAIEKEITIENKTEVPIEFRICVINDGIDEAITWENFSRDHDFYSLSDTPKEFNIYPYESTVAAYSTVPIKVTLVPNKVRNCSTFIRTYMWESQKHFIQLPIHYNCVAPRIESSPTRLDIRYCFINCPYDRTFTIKNMSDVPGYIVYDMNGDEDGLSCELSLTETFINPGEEMNIHLQLKGLVLGLRTKYLNFNVFGSGLQRLCKLTCDVQGPVICVNPEIIKFGSVPLLKWHSRTLNVMNDSPVSATISVNVSNPIFHVEPTEFKLDASEKLKVDISIYLTNVGKYSTVLILNIVNCMDPLKVQVTAVGEGSCILFDPILEPAYDLGTLMTHNLVRIPFNMTNMGKQLQKFYFSIGKDMGSLTEDSQNPRRYPFAIEPSQFDIQPQDQKIGYIEAFHTIPGLCEFIYDCFFLDNRCRHNKMFDVKITANFEDPILLLSKSFLHFRMDVTVDGTESYLEELFTVTNDSHQTLDICITLNSPFYLIDENGFNTFKINTNVASKCDFSFVVGFVAPSDKKKCSVSTDIMKIGFSVHPKVFTIPLIGDVHYPTLLTYPETIKNQYIAPMANSSIVLIIKNISPLPVAFKYEWDASSYVIEKLPAPKNNVAAIECSYNWTLNEGDEGPEAQLSLEGDSKNILIHDLIAEEELTINKLPSLKLINQTLLGNTKFPNIPQDVMRRVLLHTKYYLFPITQNISADPDEYSRIMENIPRNKLDVNESMLNVTPYQGCLQPYECNLVNISIRPPLQTALKATVKCKILGGEEGEINFTALCDDISYDIDKTFVFFGSRMFCNTLEEHINLSNTGNVDFEYAVLDDSCIDIPTNVHTVGMLTVTPNMGTLGPKKNVALSVKYFPGVIGKFTESFLIEIDYLGSLSIQLSGIGVYSQLYVMLPRPSLSEVADLFQCYIAIANLFQDLNYVHFNMKDIPEDSKLDDVTTFILEHEGWCIIEYDDENIPSTIDIDMAIERMIGFEFFQANPQYMGRRMSAKKKSFTIPNFEVPAYELSFGNVRRDFFYEQDIPIYNYGPAVSLIRLHVNDRKHLTSRGFSIELSSQKISLNQFATLNVKLSPDVKSLDMNLPYISETIYIEVNQGASIPIKITASVGIPTAEVSSKCMDFLGVIVGSCKKKKICLHNVGFIEAKWTCSINNPTFFVRKKEGLVLPGESEEIEVFFEPKAKGYRQGTMTFQIDGNSEKLYVCLNGCGRVPSFTVKERVIQFPPVLQYSPPLEETLLIQNTSSFPAELFISEYDRQVAQHDRICNMFWREMNANKVYVARSLFGNAPSDVYRYLYMQFLADGLKKNSLAEVIKVTRTDMSASFDSIERVLDSLELKVDSTILRKRPPQDIFLEDEMEEEFTGKSREAKIIVFHGNRYTDYLKAADDASKMLKFPRYSLDGMIIEVLVRNKTSYAVQVNQIIDDAYLGRVDSGFCLCQENIIEDATEKLWRKLDTITSLDPSFNVKNIKTKEKTENKVTISDKNSRKMNRVVTFQGIPEESIIRILSDKIDRTDRMILESLDSIFIPHVPTALKCFLKAVRNISCLYFVFFTCSLEENTDLLREESREKEAREVKARESARKKMLELNEFSSLNDVELAVLLSILGEKRKKSEQKRELLRARIHTSLVDNLQYQKANDLQSLWKYIDHSHLRLQTPKSSTSAMTKDTREIRTPRPKSSKKEFTPDFKPNEETLSYFVQYEKILCEMLYILEHWNKRDLEVEKEHASIESTISVLKKDPKPNSKDLPKKNILSVKTRGTVSCSFVEDVNLRESTIETNLPVDIGYPVWVVSKAHKKRSTNVIDQILGLLKTTMEMNCPTSYERVCEDQEVLYTVLTKPDPRKCSENPKVFDLVKCEAKKVETSTERISEVPSSSTLSIPTKKAQRRRKLTLTLTPSDIDEITRFSSRFLLGPGDIRELTLLFKPLEIGSFKHSYHFEVVGVPYQEKVVVQASCDYPKIDTSPITLFPNLIQSVDSRSMFLNGVYVMSQKILDLGNILLIPKNLLEMKSSICLLNTSVMLCEICVIFKDDSEVFYCEENQRNIEVKPGRQEVLTVYAKPPREGLFRETILFTIKNNPRVQEIQLSCFACPLKFDVTPKHINFNKVIVGKREHEKIILDNNTAVMVYFEFEVDADSEFKISTFNGYLEPCSSLDVVITLIPKTVGERKDSLVLKVFDKEKQYPKPVHKEVLTLFAEAADFPLEYSTNMNLGLVKGKVAHFFPFTIHNTGKYDIKVLVSKTKIQEITGLLSDCFKMKHTQYVVHGETKYTNTCRFLCDEELSFEDIPIFHITILDNYRNSSIHYFDFTASAKVSLSKFELCPHGEYFFGYQNINTSRCSILTLKNTGDFDFKYTIMTPKLVEEQAHKKHSKKDEEKDRENSFPSMKEAEPSTGKKTSDKMTVSTVDSRRKRKTKSSAMEVPHSLKAGVFTITPAHGVVQPDHTVTIAIESRPTESERYKETIIFFVSEPSAEDRSGRRLKLNVEGTEPLINFNDYSFIFPMQYVVDNRGDLSYIGENLVFERSKNTLYFGKIALNNTVSTKFRIPNVGHVTATVQYDIKEKDGVFRVRSKFTDITPFKAEYNIIEFTPRSIGICTGLLEMKCLGCKNGQDLNSSINLIGEGCMPTIEIMKSDHLPNGEDTLLTFGPIAVNDSLERTVIIRNTGQVKCKVVVDIVGDPNWYLSLLPRKESDLENNSDKNVSFTEKLHSDVMTLAVGEKGFISIKYQPQSAGRIDAYLNIIVFDNCFDGWKVNIHAFSFDTPICLIDLPVEELEDGGISYSLNFGTVLKNELHKTRFRIRNMSDSYYRFHFDNRQELIFSPSVGHLHQGSEKMIIAALKADYHVDFRERNIKLTITEIKLPPEMIFPLPWDERQNVNIAEFKSSSSDVTDSQIIPSLADAVYETNEPPFEAIGDPSAISLVVNAQCGYARYNCEVRQIVFPTTFIYKATSETVTVENTSDVNLEIRWTLEDSLESYDQCSLFEKMQGCYGHTTGLLEMFHDELSFTIEPKNCVIPPGEKKNFKITFSPRGHRAHDYFLKAHVKNLDPEFKDLEIELKGQCRLTSYDFSSSYMEDFDDSDLRFRTYCGLVAGDQAKILNFLSLGVGSECNRTLFMKNNMTKPFSFFWREARVDKKASYFHCEFNEGSVKPEKIVKTNFTFMPQSLGEFNAFFQFEPEDPQMTRTSLLLVGVCRNPKVCFEKAGISIVSTLLNNLVEEEIILRNDEESNIQFHFKKNSFISDNQQIVNVSPGSGLLPPTSRTKIRFSVRSTKQGETFFSPKCVIQYMSEPIYFNVLMNVVDVSTKLFYFDKEKERVEVQPDAPLTINLGVIIPHKMEIIRFELNNTSTIGVYYSWAVEDKQLKTKIQFSSQKGYLSSSEKISFQAKMLTIRKCTLKNVLLKLRILYGPTYIFKLEASSQIPKFLFSFMRYDFGKCLIQREKTEFYHTSLVFKNNNKWPVVLEYGQNNTEEFFIDFKSDVVDSEKTKTIEIYFSPLEQRVYHANIIFFVDSQKVVLKLYGEGVPLRMEVLSLNDGFLDFGRVRVGKSVQKSIKVRNASETTVDVVFHLPSKQLLDKMKKFEKGDDTFCVEPAREASTREETAVDLKKKKGRVSAKDDKTSIIPDEASVKTRSKEKLLKDKKRADELSRALVIKSLEKFTDSEMQVTITREALNKFLSETIDLNPKKMVKIPPNKTVDLVVKFKPTGIKEKFESNIYFQVQNNSEPLVAISGSAIDVHFSLNKNVITFGNVVVGYSNEESILLVNEGCIGGRFRWFLEKSSNYVSFIGGEGYSSPNSKVETTIIFKPGHVQCVFRFKACCEIENYKKRLEVILTGGSMNLPPPLEILRFTAAVREQCIHKIEFRNDTKDMWCVEPVFTGNYFSGGTLRVPKESVVIYEVVFAPVNINPSQHKGSVFFPLPGINSVYALEGTVAPPNPVGRISRDICCKTYHSENLLVENWLGLRQQFKVISEVLDGSSSRMIYKITSNDHFELPPYGKRDFKWTIYVVNEGRLSFKVTFLNEKTGEYLYYIMMLKITALESEIESVEFVTCVRVPAVKKILVKNPLPEAIEYSVRTSSPCVLADSSFILLPYEKYNLPVTYLPVKVEYTTAVLTISNPSVGTYTYDLTLEAQAANSEPEVDFTTHLGQSVTKTIQLSRLLQNSDATAQITGDKSFEVSKLQCQTEKPFLDILFFPSRTGTIRTSLQITSCVGDYTYPLVGESLPPEPQGPLVIAPGESVSIDVYNPFEDTMLFKYIIDNNIFQVKPTEDSIRAKKSMRILVSASSKRWNKTGNLTPIHTGKLRAICENQVEWVYYLQCQVSNK